MIEKAVEAVRIWKEALIICKTACDQAPKRFKNEWESEFQKVRNKEHSWRDTLRWYAKQGGRADDPTLADELAYEPPAYKPPSPPDRLSEAEIKRYPGAEPEPNYFFGFD